MQDNVTQSDVTEADKAAVTAFHNKQAARILAGDKTLGDNRDCIEQAFAAHRLASTAQPEVKALVEALERLRKSAALLQQNAEGCAMDHYGAQIEHGLPGWLVDTANDIAVARKALAAYHEAQP
tara:strand:- start:2658 stop:3029 length:372 start_codon:yes stop_codon:yes gene_type:complete